MKNSTCS